MKPNFTIRIYGIYIKDGNALLSKENFNGVQMLKFPGGGLEFGEGTLDCLKREMKEEFDLDVEVKSHFYTTDFFVESVFHKDTGVMSIYYLMDILNTEIPIGQVFKEERGEQFLVWQSLKYWDHNILTFPIDKKVAELIVQEFE